MSNRIEALSSEELLGMELEDLAILFLLDFADMSQPRSILTLIRNSANGDNYEEIPRC